MVRTRVLPMSRLRFFPDHSLRSIVAHSTGSEDSLPLDVPLSTDPRRAPPSSVVVVGRDGYP